MNKIIATLTAAFATLAIATPAAALPPDNQPLVEVQADCASGLTITTSGYPEDAAGMFTIGSEAPRRLALNGSVHADWPVSIDIFDYVIMAVPGDGQTVTGTVDCHVEPIVEPEPVVMSEPVLTFEPSVLFPGFELAPPW